MRRTSGQLLLLGLLAGSSLLFPALLSADDATTPNPLQASNSSPASGGEEQIPAGVEGHHVGSPIKIAPGEKLTTFDEFRPPIEITIVAKTDSTNLRIGYAAKQVIFNWEEDQAQLRIDGGPNDGDHQPG